MFGLPRFLIAAAQFGLVLFLLAMIIWGPSGAFEVRRLRMLRQDTIAQAQEASKASDRARFFLALQDRDPINQERAAADELKMALPGAVLYEFVDDTDATQE